MRIASLVFIALLSAGAAQADTPSPYAGEQGRAIKALSPAEIDDLAAGRGMGLAKAAELNSYPGPAHVLELADRLALTPDQRAATQDLFARMSADARRIGAAILAAEQALDRDFAARRIDDAALQVKLAEIGALSGELRFIHLRTHLAQAALLTPEQIRQYDALRGYADGAAKPAHGDGHGGHKQ
jgi:Spy/CpxP family protein refolding chaperone